MSEDLRSGQKSEAERELLRPVFASDHISAKTAASCSAPIAPIQEARRESAFVTGQPNTGFSAHIAERFAFIGNCQLLRVVCKASQFQAQFTLREEANNDRFLLP
jgi:hypothetical protein